VRKSGVGADLDFFERVRSIDKDLTQCFPDYLRSSGEPLVLGAHATGCLLDWEGGVGRESRRRLFDLLDQLCRLEMSLRGTTLDHGEVKRYVSKRSADEQREALRAIYNARDSGHWAKALEKERSGWFHLVLELGRRWDKTVHAELSVANVSKNWRLAVPSSAR